jgi:hypothetical protein
VTAAVRPLVDQARRPAVLAWLSPVVVAAFVYRVPISRIETMIGAIIAVGVITLVVRRPAPATLVLVVGLPFQQVVLALLYRFGVPGGIVRGLGGWKELVVVGIALAGIHRAVQNHHRPDRCDKLAMLFLAGGSAYVLLPGLLAGPNAPHSIGVLLLAFRASALFAVVFLGVRHAATDAARAAYGRLLVLAGVVLSLLGFVEFFLSGTWNRFMVEVARVPQYRADILHVASDNPFDVRIHGTIGGREFIRVGSLLFGPGLGFLLLVPIALALVTIAGRRSNVKMHLAAAVMGVAVMLTLTRSAVLALVILALVVVGRRTQSTGAARARFAVLLGLALILAAPIVANTALGQRTSGAATGTDASSQEHFTALGSGVTSLAEHPLGLGLGTSPGEAERFGATSRVTAENAYLEVGNELGVPMMIIYVVLLASALRALGRVATGDGDRAFLADWLRAAGIALAIGGLFLHVWNFELAATFWAGVALALPPSTAPAGARLPSPGRGRQLGASYSPM